MENLVECLEKYVSFPCVKFIDKQIESYLPWKNMQSDNFNKKHFEEQELIFW